MLAAVLTAALAPGGASAQAANPSQAKVQAAATLHVSAALGKRVSANAKKASVPVNAANKKAAKAYAKTLIAKKYSNPVEAARQYTCLEKVFAYESGWNWRSRSGTGYYGIPQTRASMASREKGSQNWKAHYEPQVRWGIAYLVRTYDSPCGGWRHIQAQGWY